MYKDLYKQNPRCVDLQESRRRELLTEQKKKRALLQDQQRQLEAVVSAAKLNTFNSSKGHKHKVRLFNEMYNLDYKLQLSEWLRERPEDLSDWFLVACPKGQRCMVVSCNGHTDMFNKDGRLQFRFHSMLPGDGGDSRNAISILDCIYVKSLNTFYILDALAFGNQDLLECEAQFRFFWIRSKFEEYDLSEVNAKNEIQFACLEQTDFEDNIGISTMLHKYPQWINNNPELDGFLFYHKEANYSCGTTPLVGWLFPFMISEMLEYDVSPEYQRPLNYVNCFQYMAEFDAKVLKKRRISNTQVLEYMDDSQIGDTAESSLQSLLDSQKFLELDLVEDQCLELNY